MLPGVKLNISKSGISTTIGRKGASVNIGSNGAYLNTGVPGTGIYRRDKISSNSLKSYNNTSTNTNTNSGCFPYIFYSFRGFYTFIYVLALISLLFHYDDLIKADNDFWKSFTLITAILLLMYIKPIYRFIKKLFKSTALKKEPIESKNIEKEAEKKIIVPPPISRDNYNALIEAIKPLYKLYKYLDENEDISSNIDNSLPYTFGDSSAKLSFLFHADVRKLYTTMGHSMDDINSKEVIALLLLSYSTLNSMRLFATPYERIGNLINSILPLKKKYDRTEKAFANYSDKDFFFLAEILERSKRRDLKIKYFTHLYNFFKIIAEIDNNVSWDELTWLEKLKEKAKLISEDDNQAFKIND